MAAEDYFPDFWPDGPEDDDDGFYVPKTKWKTCRYCGQTGLLWGMTNRGWKLFKGNEEHRCK